MENYLYLYCTRCLDSWTCRESAVLATDSRCQVCKCGGQAAVLAKAADEATVRLIGGQHLAELKAANLPKQ